MKKRFEFPIVVYGYGETADEAWRDALETISNDDLGAPEAIEIVDMDDEKCPVVPDQAVLKAMQATGFAIPMEDEQ